ncbi:MAG: hypothetical protein M1832_005140 [Thelocarpon impressellum]|nr:MAG: hypothetical protein M1832_005140 [Thelocarpon impressellum]
MARPSQIKHRVNWIYDVLLWTFSILIDLFFREVHPRGSWKVPRRGPVIFVAAPHANQFVDPLILMRVLKTEARRRVAFLIAEKSMHLRVVGWFSRSVGAIPVARAQDLLKPGPGTVYLPDPEKDPLLLRGVGTNFDGGIVQAGGVITLPTVNGNAASSEILEIHGPEELKLKREFRGADALKQLTGRDDVGEDGKLPNGSADGRRGPVDGFKGSKYKTAPKVDQTQVYDAVFERLNGGGCVGIFPEGGSHDRTELLPLKAGVAIMALGALAANPDCGLTIVPVGMNYFHAHKFRSRAVVEFGAPIEIPRDMVEMYKQGERREAVKTLLETVYQALVSVTVTSPDYDTLMLIQAARRLYNPTGKKLPLPMVVELNRRLVKGYTQHKDDPRIMHVTRSVSDYNKQLRLLGLRDHQVEYAKFSVVKVIFTLIYRLGKLAVLTAATLPGLVLFAPVFIVAKMYSIKKSREALAASTVKVQARDVMATWKLLVALGFAPVLYAFYTTLFTWMTYRNRMWGTVPDRVPLWAVVLGLDVLFPAITFAALRFGETGMDIFKSIRPLVLSLNPTSANTLVRLREKRLTVSNEVTELINTFGPEMFADFDSARIVADPFRESGPGPRHDAPPAAPPTPPRVGVAAPAGDGSAQAQLSRNESFGNLGSIGLFATRPPSRSRSRSSSSGGLAGSAGFPVKSFSTLNSKEDLDEVSKKIRGAMRERGKERSRRRSEDQRAWEAGASASSGAATPGSEDGRKRQ